MRVSRGPLLLCVGGCWLWFRGAGVSEGGGWPAARRWHAQPRQPRDCGPTSSFWWPGPAEGGGWSRNGRLAGCQPRAHVRTSPFWVGPPHGDGTLSPVSHVIVDRPPVSGGQARRRWGLVQNGEVDRVSTTCPCTNLPFLGRAARRWHAQPCQPRDCGPTSSFWWPGPAEGGGWSSRGRLTGRVCANPARATSEHRTPA